MTKAIPILVAVAVALAVLAPATAAKKSQRFQATLNARQEVPKPTGVPRKAVGRFAALATDRSDGRVTLRWRMSFRHLSGRAIVAHIHVGAPGKAGPARVTLCRKCKPRTGGKTTIGTGLAKAMASGKAYINIHTAKNAKGEVRGQIRIFKGRRRR